jgi:Zn-dependent M28 family amino/carboxypeptidase
MLLDLLAPLALASAPAAAATVTPDQLRRHIDVLAGDSFEGREPGTRGEKRTTDYIVERYRSAGLEPGGEQGGWLQRVDLVIRTPSQARSRWRGRGDGFGLGRDQIVLVGRDKDVRIEGAPVVFAGHGTPESIGRADLRGAVVLIHYSAPDVPGFPAFADRAKTVAAAGAAAVLAIMDDEIPWAAVENSYEHGRSGLQADPVAPVEGAIAEAAAERLLRAAGSDKEALNRRRPTGPPLRLDLRATLDVTSDVKRISSHNVIGRLRGSGETGESLLFLAHWDHLGLCRPPAHKDRVCNGAVDNASGVAVMLEVARALAAGPRPARDILFLATTAEEMGLLGAYHFAASPAVKLESIVAAINLDTVAIAPRGQKVAVLGRGVRTLDAVVERTVAEAGRALDTDREADAFLERQDGWAFARAGVPALMVGGSFSDMKQLGGFMSERYHQPEDNPDRQLILGGAAEDAELLILLGRKLTDPAVYSNPRR